MLVLVCILIYSIHSMCVYIYVPFISMRTVFSFVKEFFFLCLKFSFFGKKVFLYEELLPSMSRMFLFEVVVFKRIPHTHSWSCSREFSTQNEDEDTSIYDVVCMDSGSTRVRICHLKKHKLTVLHRDMSPKPRYLR